MTAPISLVVNVQLDCSRSFDGAATDNTSTSSLEALRMDLVQWEIQEPNSENL